MSLFKEERVIPNEHLSFDEIRRVASGVLSSLPSAASTHLGDCRQCAELVTFVNGLGEIPPDPVTDLGDCPSEVVLLEIAEGLTVPDKPLYRHITLCRRCVTTLREFAEDLRVEDMRETKDLRTASPGWQRALAGRIAKSGKITFREPRQSRRVWMYAIAAAAAVILIVGGIVVRSAMRGRSPESLLARSYEKDRLTPMRIRSARYVSSTVTRSSNLRATGEYPSELLRVAAEARSNLEKNQQDAYWHQVLGRVYLLEGNPERSIQELNLAAAFNSKASDLQLDLGTAYCANAIQNNNPSDFLQGIEHLNLHLQAAPTDPVALFNAGECLMQHGLNVEAKRYFSQALNAEKDESWKAIIQQRLREIDEEEKTHSQSTAPAAEQHTEALLLPNSALAKAVAANEAGQNQQALQFSTVAEREAIAKRDRSTLLRARFERIHALQRIVKERECLRRASALLRQPDLPSHPLLHAQTLLEAGICSNAVGDFQGARHYLARASAEAASIADATLRFRARGMLASLLATEGLHAQAEAIDVSGLRDWYKTAAPPMRAYQFASDLYFNAVASHRPQAAVTIMREAVSYALRTNNTSIRAAALELLSETCMEVEDEACARSSFVAAEKELGTITDPAVRETYHAGWAMHKARILKEHRRFNEAARTLASIKEPATLSTSHFLEIPFRYISADVALSQSDPARAVSFARQAVSEVSLLRRNMGEEEARYKWTGQARPAFQTLVKAYLAMSDPRSSLFCWESFRSLLRQQDTTVCDPAIDAHLHLTRETTFVSFVRVDASYLVWVMQGHSVQQLTVSKPANEVDDLAEAFASLCSRPGSSMADIQQLGAVLYGLLVQPVEPWIMPEGLVIIEPDERLSILPFRALITPSHRYLGEQQQIALVPGLWAVRSELDNFDTRQVSALIADATPADGRLRESDESGYIGQNFKRASLVRVNGIHDITSIVDVGQFFHYAGHRASEEREKAGSLQALVLPYILRRCRYVVLATCSSGQTLLRDSAEYEVVPARLLAAGAHCVVATRWDVQSEGTNLLMRAFYDGLVGTHRFAQALQLAAKKMIGNPATAHPYYWAGFELYGS